MSALSPTDEFAQYFKLELLANKLEEERKKIGVPSRNNGPVFSQKFALDTRAVALFISLANDDDDVPFVCPLSTQLNEAVDIWPYQARRGGQPNCRPPMASQRNAL
ncbi:hypothetical protein niasHS_013767 [Heterodera schachtii]|uniref:Uncharacterized protein n=1 Tax=Heterodera schachtii TaxID=97005 RepID=A0ABD2IWJ7_HETSC